jgi:tetratricopeptide (TPR) repeat protein
MAVEPSFPVVFRALRLDMELERWEDALALVERHLEDPVLGRTLRPFYLELLARTGRNDEMLQELGRLRSPAYAGLLSTFGWSQLLKRVAWSLYDAGEREEVERVWRRILEESPDDLEARQVVAHLFASEEERAVHLAEVDRGLAEVSSAEELLDLGTEYLAAGDDQRAYELLSRIWPSARDEVAWFNLALAALHLERWEEAAGGFREAIRRNPDRPQSHHHLATALQSLDRCDEAVPAFERGLALDPDRVSAWYWLAKCHEALGQDAAAAAAMAEYRRRDSGN